MASISPTTSPVVPAAVNATPEKMVSTLDANLAVAVKADTKVSTDGKVAAPATTSATTEAAVLATTSATTSASTASATTVAPALDASAVKV